MRNWCWLWFHEWTKWSEAQKARVDGVPNMVQYRHCVRCNKQRARTVAVD